MIRVTPIEISELEADQKRARMWLRVDSMQFARRGYLPAQWEADETVIYVCEVTGIRRDRLRAYSAMAFGEAW